MHGKKRKTASAIKRIAAILLIACSLLCFCGCDGSGWRYAPIQNVNNLRGRRVAVLLSWEADYYLTGRRDLELMRYDAVSDMLMSLKCNMVDAVAMDVLGAKSLVAGYEGLKLVEEPFGYTGYTLYFSPDRKDMAEKFNEFLAEYKQSEAYEEYLSRLDNFDGILYEGPEIPVTGTGEVLRVAIEGEGYPRSYMNPGEETAHGFDIEALQLFANENDYRLEFRVSEYDDMIYGLKAGLYDVAAGYLSDIYENEALASGLLASDTLDSVPMCFVEKTRDDIRIRTDSPE